MLKLTVCEYIGEGARAQFLLTVRYQFRNEKSAAVRISKKAVDKAQFTGI